MKAVHGGGAAAGLGQPALHRDRTAGVGLHLGHRRTGAGQTGSEAPGGRTVVCRAVSRRRAWRVLYLRAYADSWRVPAADEFRSAVGMLKLLGDETRLRVIWALLEGEHSVNELAELVGAQPAAVSQHLAKLRLARLVRSRREGHADLLRGRRRPRPAAGRGGADPRGPRDGPWLSGPRAPGHRHGPGGHSVEADRRALKLALGAARRLHGRSRSVPPSPSNSLVLLADAGHMLVDVGAIAGSLVAIRLAARPETGSHTYGMKRAEILAAAANAIALLDRLGAGDLRRGEPTGAPRARRRRGPHRRRGGRCGRQPRRHRSPWRGPTASR